MGAVVGSGSRGSTRPAPQSSPFSYDPDRGTALTLSVKARRERAVV